MADDGKKPRTLRSRAWYGGANKDAFITHAERLGAPVTVDWVNLKINEPEPRVVELSDPFAPVDERVDHLLAYLEDNAGVYGRV